MDVAAGGEQNRLWTAAKIALVIGGIGFLVSRVFVIRWASSQAPIVLLAAWYLILFAVTQVVFPVVLDSDGVWDLHHARVGVGFLLVWWSIGIVAYFPASTYSVLVSGANPAEIPPYLISSEDQVTYQAWSSLFPQAGAVPVNLILGGAIAAAALVVFGLILAGRVQEPEAWKPAAITLVAGIAIAVLPLPIPPPGGLWILGILTYFVTPVLLSFAGILLMKPEDVETAVAAFE